MQTDTFSNLLTLVKGLSGNTDFTDQETTLVSSFINRRIYNAYRRSNYWPRYFVGGEARAASSSVIPWTQTTLNSIDTFLRVYATAPHLTQSAREYEFWTDVDGAHVQGNSAGATTFYIDYKKRWAGDYNTTTNTSVPLEFFHYAAHGAYADFLRYDEQVDKANAADAYAETLLLLELENVSLQRNANTVAKRVRSHSTTQYRYSS